MGFNINGHYIPDLIINPEEARKIGRPPTPEEIEQTNQLIKDILAQKNKQVPSSSYIIVTCAENAKPESNILMLRTDPPTFIKLQPGKNILTAGEYPALKYGFSQIPDPDDTQFLQLAMDIPDPHDNGQDILEIDFSHFDASSMTTMDDMFWCMCNIRKITFGRLNTISLISAIDVFRWVGHEEAPIPSLDLSGIDFSNVENIFGIFTGLCAGSLNLSGCDFSKLENVNCMFDECDIRELILDNIIIKEDVFSDFCQSFKYSNISKISLKGWTESNIYSFLKVYENVPQDDRPELVIS